MPNDMHSDQSPWLTRTVLDSGEVLELDGSTVPAGVDGLAVPGTVVVTLRTEEAEQLARVIESGGPR